MNFENALNQTELNAHIFNYTTHYLTAKQKSIYKLWKEILKTKQKWHNIDNFTIFSWKIILSFILRSVRFRKIDVWKAISNSLSLGITIKSRYRTPWHKHNLHEFVFIKKRRKGKKCIKGKYIKVLWSRWVFVSRSDGIMRQRYISQLRRNK